MKKFGYFIFLLLIWALVFFYRKEITMFIVDKIDPYQVFKIENKNNYTQNKDFSFVRQLDDSSFKDKEHLLYLVYSIINSGYSDFTFYCPKDYKECLDDSLDLLGDNRFISYINTFVHPYNSFDNIMSNTYKSGKIELKIERNYSDDEIKKINTKMNEIIKNVVKDEKDKKQIIKLIHDYIIKNTKYDSDRANKKIIKYKSDSAYGVLLEGYGICGGYSDAMSLFLHYYDIPNFKVESEDHVWNAVYLNGKWYHLDLTWDDPVMSDGSHTLIHDYFLIDSVELEKKKDGQHNYNKEIYKEVLN